MSYIGVFVIGVVVGHVLGWQSAHQMVLEESRRICECACGGKYHGAGNG